MERGTEKNISQEYLCIGLVTRLPAGSPLETGRFRSIFMFFIFVFLTFVLGSGRLLYKVDVWLGLSWY